MELHILEREFSVLSGVKEKAASMRGLYRITDNYFRFWFCFMFSKSGFTKGLAAHADEDESVRLYGLADVVGGAISIFT
jgi:hypothetical protein